MTVNTLSRDHANRIYLLSQGGCDFRGIHARRFNHDEDPRALTVLLLHARSHVSYLQVDHICDNLIYISGEND